MTDLLKAEVLRLLSRRLTWILLALVVAGAALTTISNASSVRPVDAADWAQAQEMYDAQVQYCMDPEVECAEDGWSPTGPEYYLRTPFSYEGFITESLSVALLVFIAATVLAAAMVGGEFTSGSLATQLTFTPRRMQVMAAKVTAATAGAIALLLAYLTGVMVIGTIVFLMLRGGSDVIAGPGVPLTMVRMVVMMFFIGLLASSLTFGLGATGLTIGAGSLLLIASMVAETAVWDFPEWLIRIMPTINLMAMLGGEYIVSHNINGVTANVFVTFWQAVLYATVLVVLVYAASAVAFRRKDLVR